MLVDPIADNQTESVIAALRRGDADDRMRDNATAALLSSFQKIMGELEGIRQNLWTPSALSDAIDKRHASLCSACPARQYYENQKAPAAKKPQHWWEILLSDSVRSFLLILVLVWTLIVTTQGQENAKAILDLSRQTLRMGSAKG